MTTSTKSAPGPFWSPSGHIGRASYLLRVGGLLGLAVACVWAGSDGRNLLLGLTLIGAILLVLPQVAKRFHSCGWSGWFALLVLIPPLTVVVLLVMGLVPGKGATSAPTEAPKGLPPDPAESER